MTSSFPHDILSPRGRLGRPSSSSQKTSDRLREREHRPSLLSMSSTRAKLYVSNNQRPQQQQQRRSVFREEGLDDLSRSVHRDGPHIDLRCSNEADAVASAVTYARQTREGDESGKEQQGVVRGRMQDIKMEGVDDGSVSGNGQPWWYAKIAEGSRLLCKSFATVLPGNISSIPRFALIAVLLALMVPGFRYTGGEGRDSAAGAGADAGVIRSPEFVDNASTIEGRADSPTDICTRWSNQIANVNGTVYIYGGRAKTKSGQTSGTWNNDFLSLDLTKNWERDSPALKGLPKPSGPPAVAMGALWHSFTSLFMYGGQFSDNPPESPLPVSTWEYSIGAGTWKEWANPQTSAGNHSEAGGLSVQRSAEGSGISVPELGKSWYFGGHLDLYTTQGWSNQIARVYLKSLLEFTHPGYANSGVESLGTTNAAPSGGMYRNITGGGLQDEAGFTERADGALVYIPGWGSEGIILGLAGGTNESFMDTIDIYDIANSTWYKQATSGTTPPIRVNPCVGVVAAPDGTSFQIHLYGGQDLVPFGSQIQYSDMWILTIPSFTWIQVDMDGQSVPHARAGHQCIMWDGQMVVIGGYVGKDISCDSPGIYIFNASSLRWQNSFVSLSSSSSGSSAETDDQGSSILQGSRGYQVPAVVQSIIGGSSQGGATATSPAVGAATAGPIATGKPPTFTVTQPGSIVTQTAQATSTGSSKSGTNVGAVAAGVVAGLLALLAGYLAFCSWLYRKQLGLYKNHVAMAQRTAFTNSPDNENWSSEADPSDLAAAKGREKPVGFMLGPFGTEIGGSESVSASASADRSSTGSRLAPGSAENSSVYGSGGTYGGGVMPGAQYGQMSEGDEGMDLGAGGRPQYLGAGWLNHSYGRLGGGVQTAHSSVEDLLGGQEPSFFSVVWNPRRTLRVVNLD